MDFWIYIYTIVMLVCGAVPTYLYMRSQQKDADRVLYYDGFEDGWDSALRDPTAVKQAHQYYYENRP